MSGNGFPSTFRFPPSQGGGGESGGTATRTEAVVYNDNGSTLAKGTAVYDDGGNHQPYVTVEAADGTQNNLVYSLFGVMAEDVANGATGTCVTFGLLEGIDTSAFAVGDELTCDNSGILTNDWTGANAGLQAGYVVTSSVDGSIFVALKRFSTPTHSHAAVREGGALSSGFEVSIDGGGSPITSGDKILLQLPNGFTIEAVTLLADVSGDIEIDLWKTDASGFIGGGPTSGDSICASALPTLSSARYNFCDLTGWTTALGNADIIVVHVNSASTITRCTINVAGHRNSL